MAEKAQAVLRARELHPRWCLGEVALAAGCSMGYAGVVLGRAWKLACAKKALDLVGMQARNGANGVPSAGRAPGRSADGESGDHGGQSPEQMRSGEHHNEQIEHHWLYNELTVKLGSYERRVREGKDLDAAVEFARFVRSSGLEKILRRYDCGGVLKVDSAFVRFRAEELERLVTDAYASGKHAPRGEQSQLDTISHKLDLIAGQLAKVSGRARAPRLRLRGCLKGAERRGAPPAPILDNNRIKSKCVLNT